MCFYWGYLGISFITKSWRCLGQKPNSKLPISALIWGSSRFLCVSSTLSPAALHALPLWAPLAPPSLRPHPQGSLLGRWQLVTVLLLMFFSCCDSVLLSCEQGYWGLKYFKGKERLEMKSKRWIPSRPSGILCAGRLIILWDDWGLWLAGEKGWFRPCPRLSAHNISGWTIKWTRAAGDHPACQFILLRKDLGPVLDNVAHEHMLFIY